eukprot:CAMPEP_0171171674 /NCGR_PEP_ID=MMETSP0790-20130122/9335_1 /TAXON_ID=2925 /ORGANISM="Alexandrium catenella, Strain OF101" /LENGTH=68 /DNA_ID=CAMNT_0011636527 /DNA_START=25 /DNA_END=227 /DNA_ORIENTATION=+
MSLPTTPTRATSTLTRHSISLAALSDEGQCSSETAAGVDGPSDRPLLGAVGGGGAGVAAGSGQTVRAG